MANLNDCRLAALEDITGLNGHWQDLYYIALGGTEPRVAHINQLEYDWLGSQGATAEHLNDRWYEFLTGAGYTQPALQDKLKAWWCDGAPGLGEGGDTSVFHAVSYDPDTYEMLGVVKGVGDISVASTSTHYAPDFEGIYREYAANTPVYSGGRQVTQIALHTNDLTNGDGWGFAAGASASSATTVTLSARYANFHNKGTHVGAGGLIAGNTYTLSFNMRVTTGNTGPKYISGGDSTFNYFNPTTTLEKYSYTFVANGASYNFAMGENHTSDFGDYEITEWQIEDVTGQTSTAPSAYIENTGVTRITKTYANENGNTVTPYAGDIDRVTEAVGDALAEVPWLQYYPDGVNSLTYSRTYSDAAWTKSGATATANIIGLDGTANGGYTIAGSGGNTDKVIQTPTPAQALTTDVFYYRKSDSTSVSALFITRNSDGITLNPVTAAYISTLGIIEAYEIIDYGDLVKVLIQTNGNFAAPHEFGVYLNRSTAASNVGLLQIERHDDKTIEAVIGLDPIFTTTAAVSTTATEYDNDIANHSDTRAYYGEYMLSHDDYTGHMVGVDTALGGKIIGTGVGGLWVTADGIGAANQTGAVIDTMQKVGIVHFTNENKSVNRDGNASADISAGSWSTGSNSLWYGRGYTYPFKMRGFQGYDITSYQEGVDLIADKMT